MTSDHRRPLRVALQGGGALGAYSWGALDGLLASRRVELTHFSGTSAGALNAAICASALATGGRRAARLALASFWQAISDSPWSDFVGLLWGPVARSMRRNLTEWLWSSAAAAPYGNHYLPTMSLTPLATILARHVDFDALRSPRAPGVHVTITNVRTGLPRVVGNADLSLDVLLASACLPQYFKAVAIDGERFWDGGYTANPALWPLMRKPGPTDICLIQLSPVEARLMPTTHVEVRQRVAEVVFHSSLVAEMQAIAAVRSHASAQGLPNRAAQARFHRIGPPPAGLVGQGSPTDRSARFLQALADSGRAASRRFMLRHGNAIGDRETLDIEREFVEPSTGPSGSGRDTRHGARPPVAAEWPFVAQKPGPVCATQ